MIVTMFRRANIAAHTARFLLTGALLIQSGCGVGLEPEDVVGVNGSYRALTFRVEEGGSVTDILATGGSFQIELFTNQSRTSGRLVAPGLGSGGADLDVNLAGTWRFDQEDVAVRFDFLEDVFLEELTFLASRRQLAVDETLAGVRYLIVLQQLSG